MKLAAALLTVVTMLAMPAQAHQIEGTEVVFDGAIPCSVVCAYWIDNGFRACEVPFPPGSYVDHVTAPAPSAPGKVVVLQTTLDPVIDWDSWLCTNDEVRTQISEPGTILGEPCDDLLRLVPIACHEDISVPVMAEQTVIFRAYNWSDAFPAIGRYGFTII